MCPSASGESDVIIESRVTEGSVIWTHVVMEMSFFFKTYIYNNTISHHLISVTRTIIGPAQGSFLLPWLNIFSLILQPRRRKMWKTNELMFIIFSRLGKIAKKRNTGVDNVLLLPGFSSDD